MIYDRICTQGKRGGGFNTNRKDRRGVVASGASEWPKMSY